MILTSLSLCLTALACIVIKWFAKRHLKYRRSGIPAPSELRLFILLIFSKFDTIKTYQLLTKKHGDIFRNPQSIFLCSPEYLEVLFTRPELQQRPKLKMLDVSFGKPNLLSVGPEKSKVFKKFYFRYFVNVSHAESLKISSNALIDELRCNEKKRWIQVENFVQQAILTTIFRTAFGTDAKHYAKLLLFNMETYMLQAMLRDGSPLYKSEFLFHNFFGGKEYNKSVLQGHQVVSEILEQKKQEMKELESQGKEVPLNFIFGLLKEKEADDTINVKSEMMTLMATAMDTTSLTISFGLLLLGLHPEIQEKVFEEDKRIQEELGGREMEDKDLSNYYYLQRVLKETWRMCPSLPVVLRWAADDVQIGKYTIPKGANVSGALIAVQRDPKYFDNPLKFDPDRFLPDNAKKFIKYSYNPFSAGLRTCPGLRFGTLAATYLIAAIVRNFKIFAKYKTLKELDENLETLITLHDKQNFPIYLERR